MPPDGSADKAKAGGGCEFRSNFQRVFCDFPDLHPVIFAGQRGPDFRQRYRSNRRSIHVATEEALQIRESDRGYQLWLPAPDTRCHEFESRARIRRSPRDPVGAEDHFLTTNLEYGGGYYETFF